MAEFITLTVNGVTVRVPEGTTVAAAVAIAGQPADGELKSSGVVLFPGGEVPRRHGEFV